MFNFEKMPLSKLCSLLWEEMNSLEEELACDRELGENSPVYLLTRDRYSAISKEYYKRASDLQTYGDHEITAWPIDLMT